MVDDEGRLLGQISRRDLMQALYEKMKVEQKRKDGRKTEAGKRYREPASW